MCLLRQEVATQFVPPLKISFPMAHKSRSGPWLSIEKPNSLGSWLTKTVKAMPFIYPYRIGLESSSVMKPSRANPAAMQTAPETIAIMLARATARIGSPPESGKITARITAASEESGPRTRIRLGPNSAYASSGMMVAYKP